MKRALKWIIVVAVVIGVAVTAGPWIYIHWIKSKPPARLSFADATTTTATSGTTKAAGSSTTVSSANLAATTGTNLDGTWSIGSGSQLGYRVNEVLFGQSAEAVGRTSGVTGEMTLGGTTVTAATFAADLTSVQSDESQRDNQFKGRIMNVSKFPTATFTLTQPINLSTLPADLSEVKVSAVGDLTLRGTTKSVTVDLAARRNGATIEVTGSIPIVFADWGIPNPSFGPASTDDHGIIEVLLVLTKAA